MSRPRQLRIGSHRWRVLWSKRAVVDLVDDSTAGGACDVTTFTLAVEPIPENPDLEKATLIHEILHACIDDSGLPMTLAMEERVVATLTNPLYRVLKNNPKLREYLFED